VSQEKEIIGIRYEIAGTKVNGYEPKNDNENMIAALEPINHITCNLANLALHT
jgi:hypothetical protein